MLGGLRNHRLRVFKRGPRRARKAYNLLDRGVTAGDSVKVGHVEDELRPWGPTETKALRTRLENEVPLWDLVIVGAGITGAGIAREAAQRGLAVLVIEAHDVAYGTSSRSTRLIHGGVRYLEHGELGLVFEALRERSWLSRAAPHLVRPSRFLFPAYGGDRLGPWSLRFGLTLYDALNGFRGRTHTTLDVAACIEAEPLLATQDLRGGVAYDDAVTDDARLTLATLQDARRYGAEVLTHTRVEAISATGAEHRLTLAGGLVVHARQAVVATGPWTGVPLLGSAGEGLLTHSKGVHIVVRASDAPLRYPLVVQVPHSRRILFGVPWGSRTYLGTTDDPFTGDLHRVGITEAEELALLAQFRRVLPGANLHPERIVSAWAGIRPLVRPVGSRRTEAISRKHRIVERPDGVLAIVGGKLTTFRAMAGDLVDQVVRRLSVRDPTARRWTPSPHRDDALDVGAPLTRAELENPRIAALAPRHGVQARILARSPQAHAVIVEDLPYRWCEVDWAISHEGARHLSDILRRRLPLAITDPDLGGTVARAIALRLVEARGGNQADIDQEVERYIEETRTETRRSPRMP